MTKSFPSHKKVLLMQIQSTTFLEDFFVERTLNWNDSRIRSELSSILQQTRQERGESVAQIGHAIGYPVSFVTAVEKGMDTPLAGGAASVVTAYATYLELSLHGYLHAKPRLLRIISTSIAALVTLFVVVLSWQVLRAPNPPTVSILCAGQSTHNLSVEQVDLCGSGEDGQYIEALIAATVVATTTVDLQQWSLQITDLAPGTPVVIINQRQLDHTTINGTVVMSLTLPSSTPTVTPTATWTPTHTPTPTHTQTSTPTSTSTITPTSTSTSTPTPTLSPTSTSTTPPTPTPQSLELHIPTTDVWIQKTELRGRGEPGFTINVHVNGTLNISKTIAPDGSWMADLNLGQYGTVEVVVDMLNGATPIETQAVVYFVHPPPTPTPTPGIGENEGRAKPYDTHFRKIAAHDISRPLQVRVVLTGDEPGPVIFHEVNIYLISKQHIDQCINEGKPLGDSGCNIDAGVLDYNNAKQVVTQVSAPVPGELYLAIHNISNQWVEFSIDIENGYFP